MRPLFTFLAFLASCNLSAAIEVTDAIGRQVILDRPADRIIALAPHIVENTFSAGAGSKLVGVVSYSDFPAQAQEIPEVGSYIAWSQESIVALNPDLIILWGSGNGLARMVTLEKLGYPVYVSESRELDDIATTIRNIGLLAGTESISEPEARRVENELNALRSQYSGVSLLTVFYQVWNDPLQTINGEHLISGIIELCGGRNVFADTPELAPKINIESVLRRNPDVVVASGMDAARPEWLDDWHKYTSLKAVKNKALFFVHPDLLQRPTARILEGARELCTQLDAARLGQNR